MIKDFEKILDSELREDIRDIGIFPIMKNDTKSIQEVSRHNVRLKQLITKYNIRIY